MDNYQLNRLINLIKKTGDRLVVLDNEKDDVFVLMNLDSYEDLLSEKPDCSACFSHFNNHDFEQDFEIEEVENSSELESESDLEDYYFDTEEKEEQEEYLMEKVNQDILDAKNQEQIEQEFLSEKEEEIENNISYKEITEENLTEVETGKEVKLPKNVAFLGDVLADENYRLRKFDHFPRKTWFEEEDLSDVTEEEEEKFYLEPVE